MINTIYGCVYDDVETFYIFGFFAEEREANKLRDVLIKIDDPDAVEVYPYTIFTSVEEWLNENPLWGIN
jgi:hypothetical protein